jgi:MFS family permease
VTSITAEHIPTSALRYRRFAAFFTAAAISNAAGWMQLVAVPALLYDLTGRAAWLGLSSLATLIPAVLLTPFAGVLADRAQRRLILIITQSVQMCSTLTLWLLYTTGNISPAAIIGTGFIGGVATGFQTAAWQAFIPSLVPREAMMDAVRLNSTQFTIARAVGPAAAGSVVLQLGVGAAIFINASTFVLVIAVLVMIRPSPVAKVNGSEHPLEAMRDGARFVWAHPAVRLATILSLFTAITGQALQYIAAAVASRQFGRPSEDNAWLLTSLGVGAFLASIVVHRLLRRFTRRRMMQVALAMYALSPVVIVCTDRFWLGVVGYFIGGLAHLTFAVQVNTLIQSETPDHLRGRAMSFYLLGILAGIPVGSLTLGSLIDAYGVRATLLADAALIVCVTLALHLRGALHVFDEERSAVPHHR